MRNSKLILVLIVVLALSSFTYAETTEEVILPNGLSGSDDFDTLNLDRWSVDDDSDLWYIDDGVLIQKDYGDEEYAYQFYDYNTGNLKSSEYRFELEVFRGAWWDKPGFVIDDNSDFYDETDKKIAIVKNNSYYDSNYNRIYTMLDGSSETNGSSTGATTLKYIVTLVRKGDSNIFEVTMDIYADDQKIITKSDDSVTLNNIYVSLWVVDSYQGQFKDFKAYYKPVSKEIASFDKIQQVGDQLKLSWSLNASLLPDVKVVYSKDANITFDGTDTYLYNGSSSKSSMTTTITSDMKEEGYIGIQGYNGTVSGQATSHYFDYIEPISSFGYGTEISNKKYKFDWTKSDDAIGYRIKYGSKTKNKNSTVDSITLSNVSSPSQVTIEVKRNSIVGNTKSFSLPVYAEYGNLEAVSNFSGTLVDEEVKLTWDAYTLATSYELFRNNGTGSFSSVASGITGTSFSDVLTNDHVEVNYKLKAHINDISTLDTQIISFSNVVKDIDYEFNDSTGKVDLKWQSIGDADSYNVYISSNSDMTSATMVNVLDDDYSYDFSSSDTVNRYVQIEAVNGIVKSTKNIAKLVDYSRNNPVENFNVSYVANSGIVRLTWDSLDNASEYKIRVGNTSTNLDVGSTVTSTSYDYIVKESDKSTIYFSVQGIGVSQSFVESSPTPISTFTKDFVENISIVKNVVSPASNNSVDLRWSELFRADEYIVHYGTDPNLVGASTKTVSTNETNIITGDVTTYFKVVAKDGSVLSASSIIMNSDAAGKIDVSYTGDGLIKKYYGAPIDFYLNIKINEDQMYDTTLELDLKNIFEPSTSKMVAGYIYPEVVEVIVDSDLNLASEGSRNYVSHSAVVKSGQTVNGVFNGDGGYVVSIDIADSESYKLVKDQYLRIRIKTDLRFTNLSGDEKSILHKSSYLNGSGDTVNVFYTQMELPFVIQSQIQNLENRLSASDLIANNSEIGVMISYKANASDVTKTTKYDVLSYDIKNKNAIIGE